MILWVEGQLMTAQFVGYSYQIYYNLSNTEIEKDPDELFKERKGFTISHVFLWD